MDPLDNKFMLWALEQAQLALREDELPVGAIVVLGGEVGGVGRRTAAGNTRLDHAEIGALRQALDRNYTLGRSMTIYTTLEPCVMCFGALLNSRIGRIVYALEDPYGGATHFKSTDMPLRNQSEFPLVVGGVLRSEVCDVFREYFRTTKSEYWSSHPENPLVKICTHDENS